MDFISIIAVAVAILLKFSKSPEYFDAQDENAASVFKTSCEITAVTKFTISSQLIEGVQMFCTSSHPCAPFNDITPLRNGTLQLSISSRPYYALRLKILLANKRNKIYSSLKLTVVTKLLYSSDAWEILFSNPGLSIA